MHPFQFPASIETQQREQDTGLPVNWEISLSRQASKQAEITRHQSDIWVDPILPSSNSSRLLNLPSLTKSVPLVNCRVSVIIPVRNEAQNLPAVLDALAYQVNQTGSRIDTETYEILVLANNCTDRTVAVVEELGDRYPSLQLHAIDVVLPKEVAFVGKARQMVMDEAYRRFSLVGLSDRIIASTDGDTEVAPNWISALISEFDKGIDALGGRIMTCRADAPEVSSAVSLYYLRRVAHAYLSSQIACFLDPQAHDCWPRHFQFCGANMAVSAQMYAQIGGMPLVRDEEDVALYRRLQRADAKIRHSLAVQVKTSARQVGRATGGLSELLAALSNGEQQDALVEPPLLTEARMVMRRSLRQVWVTLQGSEQEIRQEPVAERLGFSVKNYARAAELLSRGLGVPVLALRSHIENATTFGELVTALFVQQLDCLDADLFKANTEIGMANMHLRQRLSCLCQQTTEPVEKLIAASEKIRIDASSQAILQALQQVQAIPLFPPAY